MSIAIRILMFLWCLGVSAWDFSTGEFVWGVVIAGCAVIWLIMIIVGLLDDY